MTKDEIQIELKRRFDERVYKYTDNTAYLTALADVIIEFTAEQMAEKPCVYEARELPTYLVPSVARSYQAGMWCKTHGWDCPKAHGVENK